MIKQIAELFSRWNDGGKVSPSGHEQDYDLHREIRYEDNLSYEHETATTISSWARGHAAFWAQNWRGNLSELYQLFDEISTNAETVFVIELCDGKATVLSKVKCYEREADHSCRLAFGFRAEVYRSVLEAVCADMSFGENLRIAIDVDDGCHNWTQCPVFCFQKPAHYNNILLPDIDFLATNFYKGDGWPLPDANAYVEKACTAVFVGSTTGGGLISSESLDNNRVPRIRAARFFKHHRDVTFLLPSIVQCDGIDTENRLRAEGFGGEHVGWVKQLSSKFLISMDGNGATCSRVFVGLSANSVLIKYESNYELYYFRGLNAWTHYLPAVSDIDVLSLIEIERNYPEYYAPIAKNSRLFAERYLCETAVKAYIIEIMSTYQTILKAPSSLEPGF